MSDNLDLFVGPPADCPFCGAEHINDLARNAYQIHHEEGCYFEKVFGGTHAIHIFTHYDDRIPFWNKRSNAPRDGSQDTDHADVGTLDGKG